MTKSYFGMLTGIALGDTLGGPFETLEQRHPNLNAWDGEWTNFQISDDTVLSIVLAEDIVSNSGPSLEARMKQYVRRGLASPRLGRTLKQAFDNFNDKKDINTSGVLISSEDYIGNGALMRCAPLSSIVPLKKEQLAALVKLVRADAELTHKNDISTFCCAVFVLTLARGMLTADPNAELFLESAEDLSKLEWKDEHIHKVVKGLEGMVDPAVQITSMSIDSHVVSTLLSVCRLTYDIFRARRQAQLSTYSLLALQKAVLIGGDTDTRAALLGAVLGAFRLMPKEHIWRSLFDRLPASLVAAIEVLDCKLNELRLSTK